MPGIIPQAPAALDQLAAALRVIGAVKTKPLLAAGRLNRRKPYRMERSYV